MSEEEGGDGSGWREVVGDCAVVDSDWGGCGVVGSYDEEEEKKGV